jgi:hypothetical protein
MQWAQGRLVAPPLAAALGTSTRAPHLQLYTWHFAEPAVRLLTSKFSLRFLLCNCLEGENRLSDTITPDF